MELNRNYHVQSAFFFSYGIFLGGSVVSALTQMIYHQECRHIYIQETQLYILRSVSMYTCAFNWQIEVSFVLPNTVDTLKADGGVFLFTLI